MTAPETGSIAVIGRSGQLARALADRAGVLPYRMCFFGRPDFDLALAPEALVAALEAMRPDTVINAAAFTAVDAAEDAVRAAYALNGAGPEALAGFCAARGARLIHLSTDYVFDGCSDAPYSEAAPLNPLGVYGASKAAGEGAVHAKCPSAVILRTAWVFSAVGTSFVTSMIRLGRANGLLRVVDDQMGGPTPAADIASACLSIAAWCRREPDRPGGIYHFCGAPAVTRYEFARAIIETAAPLLHRPVTLEPISSDRFPTRAPRPANSVLDCTALQRDYGIAQPDWRAGLRRVIAALADQQAEPGAL